MISSAVNPNSAAAPGFQPRMHPSASSMNIAHPLSSLAINRNCSACSRIFCSARWRCWRSSVRRSASCTAGTRLGKFDLCTPRARAAAQGRARLRFVVRRRDENEGRLRAVFLGEFKRFESAERGQAVVGQDEIGRTAGEFAEEFRLRVDSLRVEGEAAPVQFVVEKHRVVLDVLHHQDAQIFCSGCISRKVCGHPTRRGVRRQSGSCAQSGFRNNPTIFRAPCRTVRDPEGASPLGQRPPRHRC